MIKHREEEREGIIVLVITLASLPQGEGTFRLPFSPSFIPPTPHTSGGPWHLRNELPLEEWKTEGQEEWYAGLWKPDTLGSRRKSQNLLNRAAFGERQHQKTLGSMWKLQAFFFSFYKATVNIICCRFFIPKWKHKPVYSAIATYWPADSIKSHRQRIKASR